MRLLELKQYLQVQKIASLAHLVAHFKVDPELLKDMLKRWENKGCVRIAPARTACKTRCTQCQPSHAEWYEWV